MGGAAAIRIMVVDDQASMRAVIRRTLEDIGFQDIRDEGSAIEALAAVRAERVHLIISDFNLARMDGLEFLRAVRADPVIGRTGFIMLTGAADRDTVHKAAALGIDDYVVKPFAQAALREKIERLFGAGRSAEPTGG